MKILLIIALIFGWTQVMGEQKEMSTAEVLKQKHIQEQLEKEKKFAQEQKFYQGDEYDFSEQEIDPKDVETIPTIEPENDFDMTDVYRDDI
jgi:uncharacterized membrane protein